MVRIKKQYKQPDGTIIEVEGTEAEIEAFEKKQQKQKAQIEETTRKKTILYGKNLEEIRKIVREEIAKAAPTKTIYEYRYYTSPYYNPYWIPIQQPLLPVVQPTWTIGPAVGIGGGIYTTNSDCKITTTGATGSVSNWITSNSNGGPVSVFNSSVIDIEPVQSTCGGGVPLGQTWSGVIGGGSVGGKSNNYLMSPRM